MTKDIESLIDHQRWLLNNGVVHDTIKNQLFMYGSIVHREVAAVDMSIDVSDKTISYNIYVNKSVIKKIDKFKKLKEKKTIFGLWRFKMLLKKEGNLDFYSILNSFIKDYCGPTWSVKVNTVDFDKYVEGYNNETGEIDYDIKDDRELNE